MQCYYKKDKAYSRNISEEASYSIKQEVIAQFYVAFIRTQLKYPVLGTRNKERLVRVHKFTARSVTCSGNS